MAVSVDEAIKQLQERRDEIIEVIQNMKLTDEQVGMLQDEFSKIDFMLTDIEDQKLLSRGPQDVYYLLNENTDVLQDIFGKDFFVEEPKGSNDVYIDNKGDLRWTEDAIMKFYGIKPLDNGKFTDRQKMDFFTNITPDLGHYNKYAYENIDGKRKKTDEALSIDADKAWYSKKYQKDKAFEPTEQEDVPGMLAAGVAKYMYPTLWNAAKEGKYDNADSKSDLVFNTDFGRDFAQGVTYGLSPFKGGGALKTVANAATVPTLWAGYDVAMNDKPLDEAAADALIGSTINATYPRYLKKQGNKVATKFEHGTAKAPSEVRAYDVLQEAKAEKALAEKIKSEIDDFVNGKATHVSRETEEFVKANGETLANLVDDPKALKNFIDNMKYNYNAKFTEAIAPEYVRDEIDKTLENVMSKGDILERNMNSPIYNKNYDLKGFDYFRELEPVQDWVEAGKWTKNNVYPVLVNETFNKAGDYTGDAAIRSIPVINSLYEERQEKKAVDDQKTRADLAKQRQEQLNRQWRYANGKMTPDDAVAIKESFERTLKAEESNDPNWMDYLEPGFENAYNMWKVNTSLKKFKVK